MCLNESRCHKLSSSSGVYVTENVINHIIGIQVKYNNFVPIVELRSLLFLCRTEYHGVIVGNPKQSFS
jgi:hypothetical protein